jgi:uncharacterized membrane protein
MQIRFSIVRMLMGISLFAASFAYFHEIPGIGVMIGATTGTAFFLMALVTKKSDVPTVLRSYIFAGLGSIITVILTPVSTGRHYPPIGPIVTGAMIGWFVAALVNQSRRSPPNDDEVPPFESANLLTDYEIDTRLQGVSLAMGWRRTKRCKCGLEMA